jgi:hypothetical protein
LLLIARQEWGGTIVLSHREMGAILGLSDVKVSLAMRGVLGEGLILRERPDRGRTWLYHLPTVLVSQGPLSQLPWKRASDEQKMPHARANVKNRNF